MSTDPLDNLNLGLPERPGEAVSRVEEVERLPERRTSYLQRNEARLFALRIVRDKTYQDNLFAAARARKLHPSIEALIMHYAWGKPTERVELGAPGTFSDLSELSTTELAERAKLVHTSLIALEYENASPEERSLLEEKAQNSTNDALDFAKRKRLAQIENEGTKPG